MANHKYRNIAFSNKSLCVHCAMCNGNNSTNYYNNDKIDEDDGECNYLLFKFKFYCDEHKKHIFLFSLLTHLSVKHIKLQSKCFET